MTLVQAKSPTATANASFFSNQAFEKKVPIEQAALEQKVMTLFINTIPNVGSSSINLGTPDSSKQGKFFNSLLAPMPPRMI
jgi:hypothetical protein